MEGQPVAEVVGLLTAIRLAVEKANDKFGDITVLAVQGNLPVQWCTLQDDRGLIFATCKCSFAHYDSFLFEEDIPFTCRSMEKNSWHHRSDSATEKVADWDPGILLRKSEGPEDCDRRQSAEGQPVVQVGQINYVKADAACESSNEAERNYDWEESPKTCGFRAKVTGKQ
jgi:hypothetical protein